MSLATAMTYLLTSSAQLGPFLGCLSWSLSWTRGIPFGNLSFQSWRILTASLDVMCFWGGTLVRTLTCLRDFVSTQISRDCGCSRCFTTINMPPESIHMTYTPISQGFPVSQRQISFSYTFNCIKPGWYFLTVHSLIVVILVILSIHKYIHIYLTYICIYISHIYVYFTKSLVYNAIFYKENSLFFQT